VAGGIRNPARLEKCHLAEAASPGSTGSFPGYRQCAGSFSQNPTSRRIDYILVATGHSSEVHTEWLLPGYPPQVGNHGRRTFESGSRPGIELVLIVVFQRRRGHDDVAHPDIVGQGTGRAGADDQIPAGVRIQQMLRLKRKLGFSRAAASHCQTELGQANRSQAAEQRAVRAMPVARVLAQDKIEFLAQRRNDEYFRRPAS
jgi:hypothetical protein